MIHSLGPGGAESMLLELARHREAGPLDVVVVHLVGSSDTPIARAIRATGVPVLGLGLDSRWDPRAFARARGAIGTERPVVVHTHLKHADIVGGAVARRLGLPHVSTLHLIEDGVTGIGRGKRWLAGRTRRSADRVVAVSDAQRAWYVQAFSADPAQVVTVHNGVSDLVEVGDAAVAATRSQLGARDVRPVLAVNVAVMRPGKGHQDLLEAVRLLPDDSPLTVCLVGDGELRPGLEAEVAADPRLLDRVSFAGFRDDVPAVLQAADLIVHPTYADALPTSLIEALAAGLPAVATRVGGVPEVVGDSGDLVEVGDVAALSQALDAMSRDAGRRSDLSRRARARFESEYAVELWVQRLAGLYGDLVDARPDPYRISR